MQCGKRGKSEQVPRVISPWSTLWTNANWRSPAFRDSLRVGLAVSLAVLVAKLLGIEHGFWAASVALCVASGHLTRAGTKNAALFMMSGAALGIGLAAVAIAALPPWGIFVLLPIAAFFSKFEAGRNAFIVQLTYTPFAVFNLATLGWPDVSVSRDFRLEDVVIGALVALVATFIGSSRSQTQALSDLWLRTSASGLRLLNEAEGVPNPGAPVHQFRADAQRYIDTLMFLSPALDQAALSEQLRRTAWLQQIDLTVEASVIAQAEGRAPINPLLVAALNVQHDRSAHVQAAAAHVSDEDAAQLVAAIWAAWWIDHLTDNSPG